MRRLLVPALCLPLLAVLGQRTFALGDEPPLANVTKLACNFLIAAMIESLGEAVALTAKAGLAPQDFVDQIGRAHV